MMKLAGLVLLAALAGKASANLIFEWSGNCDFGCTGTASALVTTTDAYVPGTSLTSATIVSFVYTSSNGTISVPGDADFYILPGDPIIIPASPGPSPDFELDFTGGATSFCAPGTSLNIQCATTGWNMIFDPKQIDEGGRTAGSWTQVPEPGTLALLGLGLAGLAATRRRKQ